MTLHVYSTKYFKNSAIKYDTITKIEGVKNCLEAS